MSWVLFELLIAKQALHMWKFQEEYMKTTPVTIQVLVRWCHHLLVLQTILLFFLSGVLFMHPFAWLFLAYLLKINIRHHLFQKASSDSLRLDNVPFL